MSRLRPGDSVLFKRAEVFYGSINITKSGTASLPITFAAYGNGPNPEISGMTNLSGWIGKGQNLWEVYCPLAGNYINNLFINNVSYQIGRYPNASDMNKGYLNFESHVFNSQISDYQLSGSVGWTGADVVVRTNHWIIDRLRVKQHKGNAIFFDGVTTYIPKDNWGYFFQNHPRTLDKYGEWCYDPIGKKIQIYTNSISPISLTVAVSTIEKQLILHGQKHINLENITFKGSNNVTIDIEEAQSISIEKCSIFSSGMDGIRAVNSSNLNVKNNNIIDTKNNAFFFSWNCNNSIIRNNTISKTGLIAGSGAVGNDAYQAIIIRGKNNLIEYNKIDSTGYIPIRFEGDSIRVSNNFITNFLLTKDDGGGIYSWKGCDNLNASKWSKISNNILLNGVGAPEGTNYDYSPVHGIYLDDNVSNVEVIGNTIANVNDGGIFLHNAHDVIIDNNTCYNNGKQLLLQYDNCRAGKLRNVIFENNVLFCKTFLQKVIDIFADKSDISNFNRFDNNYYSSLNNVNTLVKLNDKSYNFREWQSAFRKDFHSKIIPIFTKTKADVIRFEYNSTQFPKVVKLSRIYRDIKNNAYVDSITLQPFSSKLLLLKQSSSEMK